LALVLVAYASQTQQPGPTPAPTSPGEQGPGPASGPLEVLIQLDWEGGFAPPEVSMPFGRVPAFTLLADGRVLYVDEGDPMEPDQEQLLIAQLSPEETAVLVQNVLDLGFERLESYLDQCQKLSDGTSQCVADAGYSILRVRLPSGDLREIKNWHEFANDTDSLMAIRNLLSQYRHAAAEPYVPDKATLFVQPILSAEGVELSGDWPLDPAWLVPPDPATQQWAGVPTGAEWDALLEVTLRNMGIYYFYHAGKFHQIVLVPWIPGTNYADEVAGYRFP
jgi:hypothetical protein